MTYIKCMDQKEPTKQKIEVKTIMTFEEYQKKIRGECHEKAKKAAEITFQKKYKDFNQWQKDSVTKTAEMLFFIEMRAFTFKDQAIATMKQLKEEY